MPVWENSANLNLQVGSNKLWGSKETVSAGENSATVPGTVTYRGRNGRKYSTVRNKCTVPLACTHLQYSRRPHNLMVGAPPSRGLSGTLVGVLPWSWWSVCPGGVIDHSIGASTALFGLLILTGTL